VSTTSELCHVIRPVAFGPGWFMLLTFDPQEASLLLRRMELDRSVHAIGAQLAVRPIHSVL
jgi:hypothetical protein